MRNRRRAFWLYPLFQIPLALLGLFLVLAALFGILGLGRPQVAVAIALDLSSSTYESPSFNGGGTVMEQEIRAVEAYLDSNSPKHLRNPNKVKVFGFGGYVQPLTSSFSSNSSAVRRELIQELQNPRIVEQIVPDNTDLERAIEVGTDALARTAEACRELLLVTDGQGDVSPEAIAAASLRGVKINAVVIDADAPTLARAATTTGGVYLSGEVNTLETLFRDRFFPRFNSNLKWVILWLGCAWVALMWTLVFPLDRALQAWMKLPMNISGRGVLGNALFWTAATPGIVGGIYRLLNLALPLISRC